MDDLAKAEQAYATARDKYRKSKTDKAKENYRKAADALTAARIESRTTGDANGSRKAPGAVSPMPVSAKSKADLN